MARPAKQVAAKKEDLPEDVQVHIDGEPFGIDQLTFAERKKMRSYVILGLPRTEDGILLATPTHIDILPAFVAVVKQRTEPDFSLEDADAYLESDLDKPERPTSRARGPKAS